MTNEEFSALVRDMRTAQNEYFKTRSKDALNKSKRLEKQVDEALHKHYNPDTQKSIFDLEHGTPSYVTLDKTPPDPALGRYKTYENEQVIAYVQVLAQSSRPLGILARSKEDSPLRPEFVSLQRLETSIAATHRQQRRARHQSGSGCSDVDKRKSGNAMQMQNRPSTLCVGSVRGRGDHPAKTENVSRNLGAYPQMERARKNRVHTREL